MKTFVYLAPALRALTLASLLTLAVVLSACGDGSEGSGVVDASPPTSDSALATALEDGGFPPPQLVGSWYAGAGHANAPYDPVTEAWGTPTGEGVVYVFREDGSYTKASQSYISDGPCTAGFTAFESGEVEVMGDTLATRPTSGKRVFSDSCVPDRNAENSVTGWTDEQFSWSVGSDGGGLSANLLVLRTPTGERSFRRL